MPAGFDKAPFRTWPVLLVALATSVLLTGFTGYTAITRTRTLRQTIARLRQTHQKYDSVLRSINSGIYLSGLTLRDYLLDPADAGTTYQRQLLHDRQVILGAVSELAAAGREDAPVSRLRTEVDAYWTAVSPVFQWTAEHKRRNSFAFVRSVLLPRRQAVLQIASDVERLADENMQAQERQLLDALDEFEQLLTRVAVVVVFIGVAVAVAGAWRLRHLERLAQRQYLAVADAERELRRLSQQLVSAQEEERRSVSRELHDQVGQMLTGLRMEISALAKLHSAPLEVFQSNVERTRGVLDQMLTAVRDLATGLRPSILDDLGLQAALQWQARDFARRFDVPVTVQADADDRQLTDAQRTAIFRVVQEALTNCARHARAQSVQIRLSQEGVALRLTVDDDGVGSGGGGGLGILGMKERIRSIGGVLHVQARQPRGTRVLAEIPLAWAAHA